MRKRAIQGGAELGFNFATQTTEALTDGLEGSAKMLWNQTRNDTAAITADSLNDLAKALMAYSLDPLTVPMGLQVRYSLWHRLDVGYRYVGGVHAVDLRYQWLGPEAATAPGWRSSLAVQYCSQDYGSFQLFGGKSTSLSGWTLVPAAGLEFRI